MKNENIKPQVRIFNFSGGKTSAYMTARYYSNGDRAIFCDTGREHPLTYKFIEDFMKYEGINVEKISAYGTEDDFREMIMRKNAIVLPNQTMRFCTELLKIDALKRYLRVQGIQSFESYIGFRADETYRATRTKWKPKKVLYKYPLIEDGIIKADITEYWKNKPYTLEIPPILGNCVGCFQKGKNVLIMLHKLYPELMNVWIEDEQIVGKKRGKKNFSYIQNMSHTEMRQIAERTKFLFDINEMTPAYNCACTSF